MFVPPPSSDRSNAAAWGSAVIGFEFAAAVGGFAVIGFFIDRWQGTEPIWTLALTGVGFIGGSYNVYKELRKMQARTARRTVRKDSGKIDPKAASEEVAARRGRPRPTGRVNLFSQQEIDLEDLDEVELDWPEAERDRIEEDLREARESGLAEPDDKDAPDDERPR
jgi:F0F1-type ATP synthase assembly protein I